jgi:hypothetical protein
MINVQNDAVAGSALVRAQQATGAGCALVRALGGRQARPRALVRAPGAQERPVWPVGSVCLAPGAATSPGEGARRSPDPIYAVFCFFSSVREKEARVLRGFCSNIKSRIKRVIS